MTYCYTTLTINAKYSLIQLVQTFSSPTGLNPGPLHPHLHTSGSATHPIIVLFNALVTEKRVMFLGHGKPAGQVAQFVLAASALGSGCGSVLRGFTERAFPYTNLSNNHILHDVCVFDLYYDLIFSSVNMFELGQDISLGLQTQSTKPYPCGTYYATSTPGRSPSTKTSKCPRLLLQLPPQHLVWFRVLV